MANNGQAMAGPNANSVATLAGRFGLAAFALVLAGRFAEQRRLPVISRIFPNDTPTFGLVFGGGLLVGPLGPIVEFPRH
jgi:K+-transporting ATPase A subunit